MSDIGSMEEACREIWHHLVWARRRQLERERVQRLIELTDAMVEELEQLNLKEVERVGSEWKPRLTFLFSALPFRYVPCLRARPSPSEVLDVLFDLQAPLLNLKRRQQSPPARPPRHFGRLLHAQLGG